MNDLASIIKQLAQSANEASDPDKVIFGQVTDCSYLINQGEKPPRYVSRKLNIQVSDKFILIEGDPFLIIPKAIKSKLQSETQPLYFNKGDMVGLLRIDKGSKYLLLDVI